MPVYNPGADADAVTIEFAGLKTGIYTSYTIRRSILTQPSQFIVRLGHGQIGTSERTPRDQDKTIAKLIELVPPRTPFRLYINGALQQSGHTDGYEVSGQASEIEVHGRDEMALLHDAYLQEDLSFNDETYLSMTEKALALAGFDMAKTKIFASDLANLKLTTGVNIQDYENQTTLDEVEELPTGQLDATQKAVKRAITAKVAETWGQFLDRQYRRAGIFLWAAGDGNFILSAPTAGKRVVENADGTATVVAAQSPIAKIARTRGRARNAVNVTGHRFHVDITHRYTACIVFGRAPGKKHGRSQAKGTAVDEYMQNVVFKGAVTPHDGSLKAISFRDVNVTTVGQAEFYGERRLAEFNRAGWHLQYTVPGHTFPNLVTGSTSTWAPNTMVTVDDDELGIHGDYYLEEVTFSRPPTQTVLTLMDPTHLIFADQTSE